MVQFVAQHGNLHTMLDLQYYYAFRQQATETRSMEPWR